MVYQSLTDKHIIFFNSTLNIITHKQSMIFFLQIYLSKIFPNALATI